MADELGGLDLKDSLTKKIGGLPGFAWVGIGVGAVFLYKKYKGNSASSTTSASNATATTSATTNVGYSYDAAGNLVDANGNIIQYNNGSSIAGLGTNSIWASTAANQLAATGSYSASDIAAAISGLLNGSSLTPNQQSAANAATTIVGMPPTTNPTPTSTSTSTPSPAVATPPPTAGGVTPNPVTLPGSGSAPVAASAPIVHPSQPANYSAPAPSGISGTSARGN